MIQLLGFLFFVHIAGGAIGLLTGTYVLVRKKGDSRHRLAGTIFSWGMITSGLSAMVLSWIHPNYFLFIIGILTVYLTITGNRYMRLRKSELKTSVFDYLLSLTMLLTALTFVALGAYHLHKGYKFGYIFLVFGVIALRFVQTDYRNFFGKPREKNFWLIAHIGRMTGAYIASVTAFLVVNSRWFPEGFPTQILWLIPTVLLVPFIFRWTKKYRVKFKLQAEQK